MQGFASFCFRLNPNVNLKTTADSPLSDDGPLSPVFVSGSGFSELSSSSGSSMLDRRTGDSSTSHFEVSLGGEFRLTILKKKHYCFSLYFNNNSVNERKAVHVSLLLIKLLKINYH